MTLDRKYEEAMEHIEVTPEMRRRILDNIGSMDLEKAPAKVVRFPNWRRCGTLAACLAVMLVGALSAPHLFPTQPVETPPVQVVRDVEEFDTLKELREKAGFNVCDLTGLPFEVEKTTYTLLWGEMAEITYEGGGRTATYRKALGTDDISGDYNSYPAVETVTVGGHAVTLKGATEGYTLAIWTDGTYTYAISLSEGVSQTQWEGILHSAD